MSYTFDPLVPRPIDLPTVVPLDAATDTTDGTTDTAQDLAALDQAKIFAAPDDPAQWAAWRERLEAWRTDARERHGFTGAVYERPQAAWAASCFTIAQVWLWDELLYSFEENRFTPERFLADARERFADLDAVVLWHAYPVIGIDDRNQWDFYRDVPGLTGPGGLVATLHAAGLHVFVDYNPWDTGTRRGEGDLSELAVVVADLPADGVFLDTLKKAEPELVERLEAARPGIVLEGESKLAVERIEDHSSSWAQFFADSSVPGVLRAHWYERRHMQHHVRRWNRDHTDELQSAWINGVGVMVWEVVFGVWVGWSERDAATLRRMVTVQRAAKDLLLDGGWTPLTDLAPEAREAGVHASLFSHEGVSLWTLVNRGEDDWTGPVLTDAPAGRLIDLTGLAAPAAPTDPTGSPVDTTGGTVDGAGAIAPSVTVPGRGIAALVHVAPAAAEPDWLPGLVEDMRRHAPSADARFPHRLARRIVPQAPAARPADAAPTHPGTGAGQDAEASAVVVPAGPYVLTVRYRARETGMYQGAPYVEEWKPLAPRLHDPRTLQRDGELAAPVAVAATEVTNAQFAQFLDATGYRPAIRHRFLAHWVAGRPPAGREDEPVTFVDLDDARAYSAWRGGRLPSEDEWQLAGETGGLLRGAPVVWNWTESEHSDGRTRYVMLKGGADHESVGSEWYFDGGVQRPEFSAKLLLPGLGLARSSSIGFRCAWTVNEVTA
ncbi:SUMF1/EgtB/PvdO family nonheme iron enzyme [Oerskovia sp. USHLN155]|uniref:SUMF1/EgtB/PvdO family nonheme iron enzyme n=1 Tax=Oerskovia sp. USHLN155 TaxID=3081288 RepID=UPI003018925C